MSSPAKEILLIKLGALGDVLRTTCLLGPIRRKHGPCRITWLSAPEAMPLLQGLDIEVVLSAGGKTSALLKRMKFDVVINLDEDKAACKAAAEAATKSIIGGHLDKKGLPAYTPDSAPYFDLGLLNRGADGSMARADALKQANRKTYQQLWAGVLGLELAGYPTGYEPLVALSTAENEAAQAALTNTGKPRVGVNLGAGARWPAKQPSVEKAAEIARLLSKNYDVVLFGGEAELERNRLIAAAAGEGKVPPPVSMKTFAAMISLCRALVTTDSLALHLACAVETPCVVLFGPTSAAEIELYGRGIKLEPRPACSCYYQPQCRAQAPCVDSIPSASVASAVARLLA
jgi:ADP-heptose:LPS heptosyltransferase